MIKKSLWPSVKILQCQTKTDGCLALPWPLPGDHVELFVAVPVSDFHPQLGLPQWRRAQPLLSAQILDLYHPID